MIPQADPLNDLPSSGPSATFLRIVDVAVEFRGTRKSYGSKTALWELSTRVSKGSICGIIGPNGSGKTTTLRLILDILQPDAGEIEVLGESRPRLANNRISYLPEERGLYRKMKVRHQLSYLGKLKRLTGKPLRERIDYWLNRLELTSTLDQKVESLSKGMAQKIQFIGAVLNRPELLVLDEPFSGLDPVNMEVLREVILELKREGTTVILSTHDMAMAQILCDAIIMIYEGRKVLDGPIHQIQAEFGSDTVRIRTRPNFMEFGASWFAGEDSGPVLRDLGQTQELRNLPDPQAFLGRLTQFCEIDFFEISPPNLHDIFVRIARPTPEESRETQGGDHA